MVDLTGQLPATLQKASKWTRLGTSEVPTMLVHPDWNTGQPVPVVIWMHGRTVHKELDPGRYLRWMRAGIGTCAVDLPGHGERHDQELQKPESVLDVILQMLDEVDEVVDALGEMESFDTSRIAIGGMSAGGMVTLARLCREHPYVCASVEATSGSWQEHFHQRMFERITDQEIAELDPILQLDHWREIPLQAFHANLDEWVNVEMQAKFIARLQARYARPDLIDFMRYDKTGAPSEHAGFGKYASDAKNRQCDFFVKHLGVGAS